MTDLISREYAKARFLTAGSYRGQTVLERIDAIPAQTLTLDLTGTEIAKVRALKAPRGYTHGYTCGYNSGREDALVMFAAILAERAIGGRS